MKPKLIVFDVDGTLTKSFDADLLPGVAEYFDPIFHPGCRNRPQIAFATNQGGVALRRWLEISGEEEENFEKYPTREMVEGRIAAIMAALEGTRPYIRPYISYAYQQSDGDYVPAPPEAYVARDELLPEWRHSWRKPAPGMIIQAMTDADVEPHQTLMIGDSPTDQAAARAAGCYFQWAQKFFARGWKKGGNFALLR